MLSNIWKDFTNDTMKKTGLNGYVYNFSVNFNVVDESSILNIQKNNIFAYLAIINCVIEF